ncbi:Hemolymph lipopolysaccharide-binding protein [Eumeta japonica]|uniref:Hemolymph lipopolysaccharide-binding protein n=1 Tax=Eumeta variegata TaxID=151549 RepID=A0A4C1X7Z1_EUMVA|nr:Hemolymph lipopolysaccharide-binding protein [Eumeta japonica]
MRHSLHISDLATCHFLFPNIIDKLIAVVGASCKYVPFYRRDYKYLDEYNAFYKLHQVANNWLEAFNVCYTEGAHLFYPSSKEEASVFSTLVSANGKNVTSVVLGFRNDFHLGEFITIHGGPVPFPIFAEGHEHSYESENSCIILNTRMKYSESSCDQKHPFICKRVMDIPVCPTTDKNYEYQESAKRCYKVHIHKQTWWEALATCYQEGAFLLTLDNSIETINIQSLLTNYQEYYVGIRGTAPGADLYTIKGSRLMLDGIQWLTSPGIKSNACVTMMRKFDEDNNGWIGLSYNARNCDTPLPFVCEMKARS